MLVFFQARNDATAQIGKDVLAIQAGDRATAVHVATDYRTTIVMRVFVYRINQAVWVAAAPSAMGAFAGRPAVITARHDLVDLLPVCQPNVGRPDLSSFRILGHAPGVTKTHRIYFRRAAAICKGIVRRDAVRVSTVDVNSKDLAIECKRVIGEPFVAAVTEDNVKIAIEAEPQSCDAVKNTILRQRQQQRAVR